MLTRSKNDIRSGGVASQSSLLYALYALYALVPEYELFRESSGISLVDELFAFKVSFGLGLVLKDWLFKPPCSVCVVFASMMGSLWPRGMGIGFVIVCRGGICCKMELKVSELWHF